MSESLSKNRLNASWVVRGLLTLAMLGSAGMKLSGAEPLVKNFEAMHLGGYLSAIGVLELLCAVLYIVPLTSSLGTLLVTGYFGGAIVAHLTSGTEATMAPVLVLGLLAWVGNWLRNPSMFASFKR